MFSPTSNSQSQVLAETLRPAIVSTMNRLANTCRDAALTTQQAASLTIDPSFKVWLDQLREVHENSVTAFESILIEHNGEIRSSHSLRSRVRRWWMRCSDAMTAGAPLAMMSICRREEFRVQAAYELALWILPGNSVREVVEQRFQQFVLHRSLIPARRLPQTELFLMQAERLQKIHSVENRAFGAKEAGRSSSKRNPTVKSHQLPAGASPAVNSNGSRYAPRMAGSEYQELLDCHMKKEKHIGDR